MVELSPGVIIAGKLRLTRPIGRGGMGVVWAARHLGLETEVAVKFLRPDLAASSAPHAQRFEREAKATARITHPNVVRVMDFGSVDGMPYLVMELLEGFSLADLLARGGRLSFQTAVALVTQVSGALQSAHDRGVVHRDVKPQNIFVTEGSREHPLVVKVLDFGVAKMLRDVDVGPADGELTETGVIVGSAPYMSPEQLEGRKDVDFRADLWSLAIIVFEILTGARPFEGSSFVTVGAAVLKGVYPPPSTLRSNLPRDLDHWFAKALALDPDERFPSALEMAATFSALVDEDAAAADEPIAVASPPPSPATEATATRESLDDVAESTAVHDAPSPRAVRRSRWIAPLALAALVAVGAVTLGTRGAPSCPAGMVLVKSASFTMGSPAEDETPSDETPAHTERVEDFCIDALEVTVADYAACRTCGKAPSTVEFEGLTPNGRSWESQFCNGGSDLPNHPINCVDWRQAKSYCEARGKRLPTEPEWELAARGDDGRAYPWGNDPPESTRLNACGSECSRMLTERRRVAGRDPWPAMYERDDAAATTSPVGSYPEGRSLAGIADLAGNVWEWTDSTYCPYTNRKCGDSRRVLRGGGWDTTLSRDVRVSRRFPGAETARGKSIGFRCASSP